MHSLANVITAKGFKGISKIKGCCHKAIEEYKGDFSENSTVDCHFCRNKIKIVNTEKSPEDIPLGVSLSDEFYNASNKIDVEAVAIVILHELGQDIDNEMRILREHNLHVNKRKSFGFGTRFQQDVEEKDSLIFRIAKRVHLVANMK